MRRLLIAAVVVVSVLVPSESAAGTIPSPYKVMGSLRQVEPTPGSSTLWAIQDPWSDQRLVAFHPGTGWTPHSVPVGDQSIIDDLAMASDDDGWALRWNQLFRWDGTEWALVHPTAIGPDDALSEVSLSSPDDVWISGGHWNGTTYQATIWHYDGTGWERQSLPVAPGHGANRLLAIGPTDVWLVFSREVNGVRRQVGLHWDGTDWTETPMPPSSATISDLSASSSASIWVVTAAAPDFEPFRLLHWDGTAWTVEPQPPVWVGDLISVDALADEDVWAVSGVENGSDYLLRTGGATWQRWKIPDWCQVQRSLIINDLEVVSENEIYVVGMCDYNRTYTLAMRFDGTSWTRV